MSVKTVQQSWAFWTACMTGQSLSTTRGRGRWGHDFVCMPTPHCWLMSGRGSALWGVSVRCLRKCVECHQWAPRVAHARPAEGPHIFLGAEKCPVVMCSGCHWWWWPRPLDSSQRDSGKDPEVNQEYLLANQKPCFPRHPKLKEERKQISDIKNIAYFVHKKFWMQIKGKRRVVLYTGTFSEFFYST